MVVADVDLLNSFDKYFNTFIQKLVVINDHFRFSVISFDTGLQGLFLALVPRSQQLPGHHPHGEDEDEVDDLQGLLLL